MTVTHYASAYATGQDVPPADGGPEHPLDAYRQCHAQLTERHQRMSQQLLQLLERDCERLEREIGEMAARIDTLRAGQPAANRAY